MTRTAIEMVGLGAVLVAIRWERGGRVAWRWQRANGRLDRWRSNADLRPTTLDELLAAFAAMGVDASEAVIECGRWEERRCPRCDGPGHYAGGPCFRCYGNAPRSIEWIAA